MESMRQHFIGTIADKHLSSRDPVVIGHRLLEQIAVGIGIQAQVVIQFRLHGCQRLGRWAIGIFVGVELDQLGQLGLLTGHVGHQILDEGTPEFAHAYFPSASGAIRYSALRAWAVSDSPRASTEATLPSSEAPAAEQ